MCGLGVPGETVDQALDHPIQWMVRRKVGDQPSGSNA